MVMYAIGASAIRHMTSQSDPYSRETAKWIDANLRLTCIATVVSEVIVDALLIIAKIHENNTSGLQQEATSPQNSDNHATCKEEHVS